MEEGNVIFNPESPLRLMIIIVAALLLLLIILVSRRRKKTYSLRQLEQSLRKFKKDEVRSIIIPDGIGGLLEIDRLILMDQGLLVIETYSMSGNLFGADRIDQWTQIIDGRSYKFANPLHHIHNAKHAVQLLAPKVPVDSRVVFTADSRFPKGKPDEVSVTATLEHDLHRISDAPKMAEMSQKAWQRILRIARKNGQAVLREGS